jgi:lipoyl-dependent peroxiredoxin
MEINRRASAIWQGSGKEGKGSITTGSEAFKNTPYSFAMRFENEDGTKGTNPEELIAAAHASCFAMKLSFVLGAANFTPTELDTTCKITLKDGAIIKSHISLNAKIDGISNEVFQNSVADAKDNCPISKLYNCEIVVEANLL